MSALFRSWQERLELLEVFGTIVIVVFPLPVRASNAAGFFLLLSLRTLHFQEAHKDYHEPSIVPANPYRS